MRDPVFLSDQPLFSLVRDELVQRLAVAVPALRQGRVAAQLARHIVLTLPVAGNPDKPGRQIERRQVGGDAAAQETHQPMIDYLSPDIDHLVNVIRAVNPFTSSRAPSLYLDVLQAMFLFVLADLLVRAFVGLDPGLEVGQRLDWILILVVRP